MKASALEAVGATPLIHLARLHPGPGRLFAKAEFLQPGGSVKDRAAREILLSARGDGSLRDGMAVVEMTSGNMGAGLAVACAVLGHRLVTVMSAGNSEERARMLRGLGAEVVLVPQVDGAPGRVTGADVAEAQRVAVALARERHAFYVDQFHHPGSVRAHERTTGPELHEALGGELDGFVAAVGSGGTFVGTSRFLKSRNASVRCAAVEPAGAAILAGEPVTRPRHLLQGIGYGLVPPHWEPALCDRFFAVTDEEATAVKRELAVREGLYVGYSAAANVAAARRWLASGEVRNVATILCDTGLKYPA